MTRLVNKQTLQGKAILLTRTESQNAALAAAIEQRGGTAVSFPVIAITARAAAAIDAEAAALPTPDIAVFVSPNAARFGADAVRCGKIAAIGPGTKAALQSKGKDTDICPSAGFDSESLLAAPALQKVAGKTVWIVRGNEGRELLASTLRERGANVCYLSVYDRDKAAVDAKTEAAVEQMCRDDALHVVTAMSVSSYQFLGELLTPACASAIGRLPLVTPAARVIKELLKQYPSAKSVLARKPTVDAMLQAIELAVDDNPD